MPYNRYRRVGVFFFALLLLVIPVLSTAAEGPDEVHPEQRISQILRELAAATPDGSASSEFDDLLLFSKDGTKVAVRVMATDVIFLLPLLEGYAFELVGADPDRNLVEGYLPVDRLLAVSELTSVGLRGVVPVYRPVLDTGSVTSEADVVHEANRVRAAAPGYDGAGITIGALSDSFDNLGGEATDISTGDLPGAPPVNVIQDLGSGGSDEGRAMIQLMYDLAPGAQYAFATAFTGEIGFADNIRALAAAGATVIVDDVVYFNEPFFQDGIIAEAVNDVYTNNGVAYFSSAGNRDTRAYESTDFNGSSDIVPGPGSVTAHDFDPGVGVDTRQGLTIANGESISLALQWDDPFYVPGGVDTDLDIYLLNGSGLLVAQSANPSDDNDYPFELLSYQNPGSTAIFDLIIVLADGPPPGRLKYVNFGSDISGIEYDTNSPTVNPHAAAVGAQAVAAAFYADHLDPEPFTSHGPSTFLFDAAGNLLGTPEVRQTPDYAAVDGVNNTFFGSSDNDADGNPNFFGTSAAAPHAAALAALIRQANPGSTPAQVYDALADSATDITSSGAGFDNVTGAGLLNVYDALYPIEPTTLNLAFSDNLEAGFLSNVWETRTNGPGRILVTTNNGPNGGSYHVTMDTFAAFGFGLNELILHLDLRSGTNVTLEFYQKESSDQDHPMSATFTDSENSDGVALSVDGGTIWYRLVDLTGANSTATYQLSSINLSTFASTNGLTLGEDVRIKFQQYGLFSFPNDGFAFDDIQVSSSTPTAVTLGAVQAGQASEVASWSSWAILLLLALGLAGVSAAALGSPVAPAQD